MFHYSFFLIYFTLELIEVQFSDPVVEITDKDKARISQVADFLDVYNNYVD